MSSFVIPVFPAPSAPVRPGPARPPSSFVVPLSPSGPPGPSRDALADALAALADRFDAAADAFSRLTGAAALHVFPDYASAEAAAPTLLPGDAVLVAAGDGSGWYSPAGGSLVPLDPSGNSAALLRKADRASPAVAGHLAGLDASGSLVDSGKSASDFAPASGIARSALDESVRTSLGKADTALQAHQPLDAYVDGGAYDSANRKILLKHGSATVAEIDAAAFIKDGMVESASVSGGNLVITFNTDAGKEPVSIPLTQIFDPANYYNKTEANNQFVQKEAGKGLFSGSYNDLSDKPTIPAPVSVDSKLTTQGAAADAKVVGDALRSGFSPWAFSGIPSGYTVTLLEGEEEGEVDLWITGGWYGDGRLQTYGESVEDATEFSFSLINEAGTGILATVTATRSRITPTKTSQLANDGAPNGGTPYATTAQIPDVTAKADKAPPLAAGNLAALDAQGNLADSKKSPSDFAPASHASDGSVHHTASEIGQIAAAKVAEVVADAPANLDTLKEIADVIGTESGQAAGGILKRVADLESGKRGADDLSYAPDDWFVTGAAEMRLVRDGSVAPPRGQWSATVAGEEWVLLYTGAFWRFGTRGATADDEGSGADATSLAFDVDGGVYNLAKGASLALTTDIPAAQVNADWNAASGVAQILNKPALAAVATSGSYDDLSGKPTIPAAQVNADWNAASGVAQILNKPTIPAAQVNADWNAASGVAQILNKPVPYTIPYGALDATSTATAMTVTVSPPITKLEDGLCIFVKNGVVTSASGFTIDVNGLGAKPVYSSMAVASRETTIFNVAYTVMLMYDSTRVEGGCWVFYRGYDSNTNTIAYQVRSNYLAMTAAQKGYRYRIWFTSADGKHWVPANTSSSTNATATRTPNTAAIDPFGRIVYNSTNGTTQAGDSLPTATLWEQYVVALGYSFNDTGAALTLTFPCPVWVKCQPQTDGSALLKGYVQSLPNTADGFIYIYLGNAYSATSVEMFINHPVYWHDGTGIRIWTGSASGGGGASPSSATPLMDGTASAGSSNDYSRGDHVHPMDTTRESVSNKVTSLSSSSTDTQYPSAKCMWDIEGNIEAVIDAILGGNIPSLSILLPYALVSPTQGILSDRAVNAVTVSSTTTLTMPAAVSGKARDFLVRMTVSGSTVPTITFADPTGETLAYETDDSSFPVPDAAGTWIYSFTETAASTFAVALKTVSVVSQGGAS